MEEKIKVIKTKEDIKELIQKMYGRDDLMLSYSESVDNKDQNWNIRFYSDENWLVSYKCVETASEPMMYTTEEVENHIWKQRKYINENGYICSNI